MATKRNAPKKSSISVDFSDTEASGVIDEGDYLAEVEEVEKKVSDNSGADYLAITFKVAEGPFKGKKLFHNCSLQPQALFNLRGVLEALGFEVPQGVMELDVADMIGESCGVTVAHEQYQGKTKARPVEFFPAEDLEDGPGETTAATKVVKKAAKAEEPDPAPTVSKKKKAPAAPSFAEGDKVTFTDDEGNEKSGTITGIEDDTYTVTTGAGKKAEEWELEASDLTKA